MTEVEVVRIELGDDYLFSTAPLRVACKDTHLDVEVPGLYWTFVQMLRRALAAADESWERRAAEWFEAIPKITGPPAHDAGGGVVIEKPSSG